MPCEMTNKKGLTSFALHILAMIFMLCDHLWGTFLIHYDILTYIGRLAFPLFAFLLAEGFFHTADKKKYALRLLLFALISEIPFNLMMEHRMINPLHQNVLWTFLLSLALMTLCEKIRRMKYLILRLLCYVAVCTVFYLLGLLTFVDYYGAGIMMVALFYFTHTPVDAPLWKKVLAGAAQLAGLYWISAELIAGLVLMVPVFGMELEIYKQSFSLLALPLIWLYNGRQGRYSKGIRRLYYWFYPVHMAILGILISVL